MIERLLAQLSRFRRNKDGQIAIIFAISSLAVLLGLGAGIDLARAYSARQKLSEVATLACQFSTRPSVAQTASSTYTGSNGFQTYVNAVNAFATSSLASQAWNWPTPTGPTGATGVYFTATPASGSVTTPTNAYVTMAANIPTALMQLAHITQIPVKATINCQSVTVAPQIVNPGTVLQEGFETPCAVYCFQSPTGTAGTIGLIPLQTFPPTPGYTGSYGYKWYIMGYCLETDVTGVINATSPEGSHTAELDCDNGIGTAGNSSISTKLYLAAGNYELRYNYRSRIDYPNYDPTYLCGSTASDLSWANDNTFILYRLGTVSRTNQINVYLDQNSTGTAPLHTTLDGTQQLAGSNLIDECVYSPTWIERSVRITINTPAFYWLSFAADGQSDSYGGQLDNIRMCPNKCATTPQDNFPPTWLAANNSGANKVLFEDTFELPIYVQDPFTTSAHSKGGNLSLSLGTSGNPLLSGWPLQVASGWATAPYNEVAYWEQGATQGTQYVTLQGYNTFTNSSDPINRSISRSFLLDPGYYNISYYYTSMQDFSYDFVYGASCYGLATSNYAYSVALGSPFPQTTYGTKNGRNYGNTTTLYNQYLSTNLVQTYMSSGQLISTPNVNLILGGAVTYTNPNGTVTSTPTVAPDNGSVFTSNSASSPNPIIDACIYSAGHAWVARSVNVMITKPGFYWLTFSSQGDPLTGNGAGAALDDVKLTALGSLYMSNPPTSLLTTIPVPAPQPDTAYTNSGVFNGFSIVADPKTPPGGP